MTDAAKLVVEERKNFIRDFMNANPLPPSGAALYAELTARYPDITAGGHRGMVGRMFPDKPWELRDGSKACPNVERGTCKVVVTTMSEALAKFGHRCKGKQLQSHCKDCRNRGRREARAARNAKAEAAKAAKEQ